MKKHIYSILILIISTIFVWYFNKNAPEYEVISVDKANIICIDFNENKNCDDGEKVRLYGISAFPEKFGKQSKYLEEKYSIKEENAVVLGVMSRDYTTKELLNNRVKVNILDDKTNKNLKIGTVYYNDEDFSMTLLKNGWATAFNDEYKIYENLSEIKKNITFSKKFNYQLKNLKNGKIHTLDCEYGRQASHYEIGIFNSEEDKKNLCGYCHGEKKSRHKHKSEKKNVKTTIHADYETANIKIYFLDFTNQLKPDKNCMTKACKILLDNINSSKSSLDFAIYGLGDIPKIENALKNASARGVKIRYVLDEDSKHENIYAKSQNLKTELTNFKTDYVLGETSKFNNFIMHNKFFIFDKSSVWLGSSNVSETDLSGFSSNNVIFIKSKAFADIYESEFEQMYGGKFHTRKSSNKYQPINLDNTEISVYFSPQDKVITNKIIPIINKAKQSILVESFIITHKAFAESLVAAKNRGVKIRVMIDATSSSSSYSMVKYLRNQGVEVKVENYAGKMHMKSIIVDDDYFIAGSMNLTKSGESYNDENCVIFKNNHINSNAKKYFNYIWSKIPERYLKSNVSAESKYSIGSCFDGVDNDYNGKTDSQDDKCKELYLKKK